MSAIRILGLDIATKTGWAHSNGKSGVWDLARQGDEHVGHQCIRLYRRICHAIETHGVDLIGYEDTSRIVRHTHAANSQSMFRAVMFMAAAKYAVPLEAFTPSQIKSFACGAGGATKEQMMHACWALLRKSPTDDNEADALWVMEFAKHRAKMRPELKSQ